MTRNETTSMNENFSLLVKLLENLELKISNFDEKFSNKIDAVKSDVGDLGVRLSVVESKLITWEKEKDHKNLSTPVIVSACVSSIVSLISILAIYFIK
jgi:uncharacterized protein (UPF0262 family)